MAPAALPLAPSGEQIRQVTRSVSSTLSSPPTTAQRDIPEDIYASIHRNIPLIPRAIQHVAGFLSRASTPITTSIALAKRQVAITPIPTKYADLDKGPAPGTVVGIVIGSVAGFLLILWLLYTCFTLGGFPGGGGDVVEEEIVRRRSRSPRRRRTHSETIEITKSRSPPRRQRERVVVEETRRVSRPPEPEPEETIDDIVEVIEEHSPSPPPPSRRTSKRTSGFRTVDPAEFGGGGRPMRKVR